MIVEDEFLIAMDLKLMQIPRHAAPGIERSR
jgi:hypothetical protein